MLNEQKTENWLNKPGHNQTTECYAVTIKMTYISSFIKSKCIVYSLLFKYICVHINRKRSQRLYIHQDVDTSHGGMVAVWIFLLSSFCSAVLNFFPKYYVLILQWKAIFNFKNVCSKRTNKLESRNRPRFESWVKSSFFKKTSY